MERHHIEDVMAARPLPAAAVATAAIMARPLAGLDVAMVDLYGEQGAAGGLNDSVAVEMESTAGLRHHCLSKTAKQSRWVAELPPRVVPTVARLEE